MTTTTPVPRRADCRVSVYVGPELGRLVDEAAARGAETRSSWVRRLIAAAVRDEPPRATA